MIEPITPNMHEWDDSYADFEAPVTKFIYTDAEGVTSGERGLILMYMDEEHLTARLVAMTGALNKKVILVEELEPGKWPVFVEEV